MRKTDLSKTVVTADALHCQRETADIISRQKGIYILPVKDNQPLLKEEIVTRLEKNRNRLVKVECDNRLIEIYELPSRYARDGFTGMKAFIRMVSAAHSAENPATMYFISNTNKPSLIADGISKRWQIENNLHREKDLYLKEDDIRSTDKNTLNSFAVLNNLAMEILILYAAITGTDYTLAKIHLRNYAMKDIALVMTALRDKSMKKRLKQSLLSRK